MIRTLIVLWMVLYLTIRRKLCRHSWGVVKSGCIREGKQLYEAQLLSCTKCSALAMVTSKEAKYITKFERIQKEFIPDVYEKGDEDYESFDLEIKYKGKWVTLLAGYPRRGLAAWDMVSVTLDFPEEKFRVKPQKRNAWLKISHHL